MLELTITADSAEALISQVEGLRNVLGAATTLPAEEPAKAPAKGKGKALEPKPDPVPEKAPEEVPEAAQTVSNGIAYDQVKEAVIALHQSQGRDAVLKVLKMFDVDHASKLAREQWPSALRALTEATMA